MALTAETQPITRPGIWVRFKVKGSTKIYKGARVVLLSGYVKNAADGSGEKYVGLAQETVDNSGGADGALDIAVELPIHGADILHQIAMGHTITVANVGSFAYLVDENTADLSANVTNHTCYGEIVAVVNSTTALVDVSKRFADATSG